MAINHRGSENFLLNLRRVFSCYYFMVFEMCATQIHFLDALLTKWRKPMFLREMNLLKITAKDKIIHIGCGALPSASIFFAQQRKVQVAGIDNNRIAVKFAQSYIRKKNMSGQISIKYADGVTFPVHDFDVLIIAGNVWPIDSVLVHLARSMKHSARILCKGIHNDFAVLLKEKKFQSLFSIHSFLEGSKTQSFLLTKKVNV